MHTFMIVDCIINNATIKEKFYNWINTNSFSVRVRLKSVTNIQKITKSMKMVSAAKYARAERDLKVARPYGLGAKGNTAVLKVVQ